MFVLKHNGKIFGANLTKAEETALTLWCEQYINNHLAEEMKKHWQEVDAIFLWKIHERLGHGHQRLWEFYKDFHDSIDDMIKKYELDDNDVDRAWICTYKLKEYGIDIEEWHKKATEEREKNGKQKQRP